jgi:putative oxidoreductase
MASTMQSARGAPPFGYGTTTTNVALTLLRIMAGLLLMQHGLQKLFGWFGGIDGSGATVQLTSQLGLAGVLETFGGALVALGLLTRPVAFLLAGEMAVVYFQAHFPHGFFPIMNRGEPPVLFCFIFLAFAAIGGGPYSIDALIRSSRGDRAR